MFERLSTAQNADIDRIRNTLALAQQADFNKHMHYLDSLHDSTKEFRQIMIDRTVKELRTLGLSPEDGAIINALFSDVLKDVPGRTRNNQGGFRK